MSHSHLTVERIVADASLPHRVFSDDAGIDIAACIISESGRPLTWTIPPRSSRTIPTGLRIKPPRGHAVFVLSRSGLADKYAVFVANSPGLIDPGYRGELKVILYNGGAEPFYVQHGNRIAQLYIMPISEWRCDIVEEKIDKDETIRGSAGFGSSGL